MPSLLSICYLVLATSSFSLGVVGDSVTSFTTATCVPGSLQTSFPNCLSMDSMDNSCVTKSSDEERKAYLCVQGYINAAVGCENEMRMCYETDYMDDTYQSAVSLWHSHCDTFTTFPVTTPALSAVSTTYDALCGDPVKSACNTASILFHNCESSYPSYDSGFNSCLCQPRFISLDYTCEFLGNTSCMGAAAATTDLIAYGCLNYESVMGAATTPAVVTVSLTSSSKTTSPTPSVSSTITSPTAAKTSDGLRFIEVMGWTHWLMYTVFFSLVLLLL